MEIVSFVLGVSLVVVIGIAVIAVMGFFKASKLERFSTQSVQNAHNDRMLTHNRFVETENDSMRRDEEITRKIDDLEREIYSQLDSRLDKLEKKLLGQNIVRGLSKESLERSKVIMNKIEE